MKERTVKRLSVRALLLGLGLAACQTTGGPTTASSVQVSFATRPAGAPLMSATGLAADTQTIGGTTLIITQVELVLRQIELRRADGTACAPGADDDDDDCEEFAIGPVLVDLPLTSGASQAFEAEVPPGTYSRVDFEIHKPDDGDPADQLFVQQHPEFAEISIRVTGTYDGVPFVHTTELDVEQELELVPALVVAEGIATNLTIFVDVSTWYVVNAALVDPVTANKGGENESAVNNNITDSFSAFEDPDGSGSDDDDD
jgi:hypothetical protein